MDEYHGIQSKFLLDCKIYKQCPCNKYLGFKGEISKDHDRNGLD
jgi:hypothetical protein